MTRSYGEKLFSDISVAGFFGVGKSNIEIMKMLPSSVRIILRSEGIIPKDALPRGINPWRVYSGERAFDELFEDVLFLSPSVRRERSEFSEAAARGVRFSSDLELFLSENKSKILAVTGSDGKSTTSTLTREMLKPTGDSLLLGNIGTPFVTAIGRRNIKLSVCELSSFQLSYCTPKAYRGAVTNITPNHLNWHKDLEEYKNTKLSLLDGSEYKIISADDKILADYGKGKALFAVTSYEKSQSELESEYNADFFFTVSGGNILKNGEKLISVSEILKNEEYNIKNLMTALALTEGIATPEIQRSVAKSFSGLPHRCELFAEFCGIKFINSSIDTSAQRTISTLNSLGKSIIIILGGRDKGLGYRSLAPLLKDHVKLAVLTGESREAVAADIKGSADTAVIEDFSEAVLFAASVAKSGDTVLLSPASVSYDAFSSFEKRGEKFKEIINDYIKNQENSNKRK